MKFSWPRELFSWDLFFFPSLLSFSASSFDLWPHTPSAHPFSLCAIHSALILCLEFEAARSEPTHVQHRVVALLSFHIPIAPVPATITWPNAPLTPRAKTKTVSHPMLHP